MFTRFILIFFAVICLPLTAYADIGRVKKASGDAYIERRGERIEASPGVVLEQWDVLVTGDNSRLSVTFIDNSRFAAGPNSRIQLQEFIFNTTTHKGKFETKVVRGSLAVVSGQIAKETPDAMKIRTPTSILGVRGTRFIVEVGQ